MEEVKSDSEILAEIYRNAQLGLESISDILPEIEDEDIKEEILHEHEEYERICSEAAELAHLKGIEVKEPSMMKKTMMKSAIKMNTVADNSAQHIAQMMIKGTVTGITSLKTSLTDGEKTMDAEIKALLSDLISVEERFEKKLKSYL
jgi:tRNA A-37 threonylcarbamoyl transferase component Bud32